MRLDKSLKYLNGKEATDITNLHRCVSDVEPLLNQFILYNPPLNRKKTWIQKRRKFQFENYHYEWIASVSNIFSVFCRDVSISNEIKFWGTELSMFNGSYEQWFPFYDIPFVKSNYSNDISCGHAAHPPFISAIICTMARFQLNSTINIIF